MKNNLFKFTSLIIIASIISFTFYSCKSGAKKQTSEEINKEEIKKELQKAMYPIPSPFELTKMLNEIEASYIGGIINDSKNYNKYLTVKQQALNVGVYSADLAYVTTYNLKEEPINYMNSIKELVKELDIASAINEDLVNQINANQQNKDKLIELITELLYSTYSYLNENNNEKISYLILAGTWIEGMYLATNISENTLDNIKIVEIIMKQEESLRTIINLIEPHKSSELLQDTYSNLSNILKIYELQPGTTSLTRTQLEKIKTEVSKLRDNIINK
jgi:hypothetical protein